jgi:hypothetical protein
MVTFFVGNCSLSLKPTLNFVVKNYLKFQQWYIFFKYKLIVIFIFIIGIIT